MRRMAVFNTSPFTTSYGGVGPFMKNIDIFLQKHFEVEYINMPKFIHDLDFLPRRLTYMIYILLNLPKFRTYDIFFSHVPEASVLLSFINKPLIHIFHGNYNAMSQSRFWYGKYLTGLFDFFDKRIIGKASLKYTVGNQREGISKILNPINHQVLIKKPNEREGFVFAGRLEKIKNVDKIINAYSELPETIQTKEKLYIAGLGTQEENLKKLAFTKSLSDRVFFAGSLKNDLLIDFVSYRKILLMASSQEGMPMAIAEALSVGVPVIATDTGDISKFVINGYNGFILSVKFEFNDYNQRITEILSDYERFSQNAKESSSQFDAEYIVKSLVSEIDKI